AESFRSAGLEVARAGPTRAGLSFIGVSNRAALPGLETSRFVPVVRFLFKDFKFVDGEAYNCMRRWPSREEFMRDPVVAATAAIEALVNLDVPDRVWVRDASDCVPMLIERGADGRFSARPVEFGDREAEAGM